MDNLTTQFEGYKKEYLRIMNFIQDQRYEFVKSTFGRYPTNVHMHPEDADNLKKYLYYVEGYGAIQGVLKVMGMRVLRSFDLEPNEIFVS